MNFGLELLGTQTQPAAPQAPREGVDLRSRNTEAWIPTDLSMRRQDDSRAPHGPANRSQAGTSNQAGRLEESPLDSDPVCLPGLAIDLVHGFQPVLPRMGMQLTPPRPHDYLLPAVSRRLASK